MQYESINKMAKVLAELITEDPEMFAQFQEDMKDSDFALGVLISLIISFLSEEHGKQLIEKRLRFMGIDDCSIDFINTREMNIYPDQLFYNVQIHRNNFHILTTISDLIDLLWSRESFLGYSEFEKELKRYDIVILDAIVSS